MKSVKFRERVSVAPENDGVKGPFMTERRIVRTLHPLSETQLRSKVTEGENCKDNGVKKCILKRPHPLQGDLESRLLDEPATPIHRLARPFSSKELTPVVTATETRPIPALNSRTPSCVPPRPTLFHSRLRPPSSKLRPSSSFTRIPYTPTCHHRHDNTPFTLPAGLVRSAGGGGVLRRTAQSNTCHKHRKVQRVEGISSVRVNLQTQLEQADGREGADDDSSSTGKDGGHDVRGHGLPEVTSLEIQPTSCSRYRMAAPSHNKGAWPRELASLPTCNYYELEKELVELSECRPVRLDRLVDPVVRCGNPLALQLDQHFLVSLSSEHQLH